MECVLQQPQNLIVPRGRATHYPETRSQTKVHLKNELSGFITINIELYEKKIIGEIIVSHSTRTCLVTWIIYEPNEP